MSKNSVYAQIVAAKPGDEVVYHHGIGIKGCDPQVLDAVRMLYDTGKVELFLRRGFNGFDHVAFWRRKPIKRPAEHTFSFRRI